MKIFTISISFWSQTPISLAIKETLLSWLRVFLFAHSETLGNNSSWEGEVSHRLNQITTQIPFSSLLTSSPVPMSFCRFHVYVAMNIFYETFCDFLCLGDHAPIPQRGEGCRGRGQEMFCISSASIIGTGSLKLKEPQGSVCLPSLRPRNIISSLRSLTSSFIAYQETVLYKFLFLLKSLYIYFKFYRRKIFD